MTGAEAKAFVAVLKAAYPRQEVTEETLAVYATSLADLERKDAEAGLARHVKTSRHFPTIAELRLAAVEQRLSLPGAGAAWLMVVEGKKPLPEPVQRALAVVGGSWAVRTTENTVALRAQFLRAYEEFRADLIVGAAAGDGRESLVESGVRELTP